MKLKLQNEPFSVAQPKAAKEKLEEAWTEKRELLEVVGGQVGSCVGVWMSRVSTCVGVSVCM